MYSLHRRGALEDSASFDRNALASCFLGGLPTPNGQLGHKLGGDIDGPVLAQQEQPQPMIRRPPDTRLLLDGFERVAFQSSFGRSRSGLALLSIPNRGRG